MTQRGIAQITAAGVLTIGVLTMAGIPIASKQVEEQQYVAIRWLDVAGEFERVSADQIRSAAAPHLDNGFFALDLDAMRESVEGLPWVREAQVRKRWPDQVRLEVTEHEPLARWGENELISHRADVFRVQSASDIAGLPRLDGPADSAQEVVDFYAELRHRLTASGLVIEALELSPRGAWQATLTDGMQVLIGREQPLQRFERFVASLDELGVMPGRVPRRVDLRYPNGFAVSWPEQLMQEEANQQMEGTNGES